VSPSHGLQLFTNCPSVGPCHGVTGPASKPAPAWAPLSTGLQVLAGACSSAGSPWGHSFLQASTCSSVGSLPWAAGGDLLHRGPPWTAGGQPASPRSSRVAREGSLLQHFGHLLPPPASLTLVSAELFLSHHLTPLSTLLGLALGSGGSVLEPTGTGVIRHGGSFLQLLTEATPIAHPATKTLPRKPITKRKKVLPCAIEGI